VLLINYEELVGNPTAVVARTFDFVGLAFEQRYVTRVFGSSVGRRPTPDVDPDIAALCDRLMERFARQERPPEAARSS